MTAASKITCRTDKNTREQKGMVTHNPEFVSNEQCRTARIAAASIHQSHRLTPSHPDVDAYWNHVDSAKEAFDLDCQKQ